MITIRTFRHIVLDFHSDSDGVTTHEINEIANAKIEEVINSIGQAGVTGRDKGKEVYWELSRG